MNHNSQTQKITYYRNKIGLALFACFFLAYLFMAFLALHSLLDAHVSFEHKLLLVAGTGIVSLGLGLMTTTVLTHLQVTPEGIAYSGIGFSIYTPWYNVTHITQEKHPLFPSQRVPVFVLAHAASLDATGSEGQHQGGAVVEQHWWLRCLRVQPETYIHTVPLPSVLISPSEWQTGKLRTFLQQYAPHVVLPADQDAEMQSVS